MGLHLDLEKIFIENSKKQSSDIVRKYGCIINSGDNMKKKDLALLKRKNTKLYGLSTKFVLGLNLPKAKTKEWLKVLTLDQILKQKSGFTQVE